MTQSPAPVAVARVIRAFPGGTSVEPSAFKVDWLRPPGPHGTLLYAGAPPQAARLPLTDAEIDEIYQSEPGFIPDPVRFACRVLLAYGIGPATQEVKS